MKMKYQKKKKNQQQQQNKKSAQGVDLRVRLISTNTDH